MQHQQPQPVRERGRARCHSASWTIVLGRRCASFGQCMSKETYCVGDLVLVYHHRVLYRAVIEEVGVQKRVQQQPEPVYRIHYEGWASSKWDEWVPATRIRPRSEESFLYAELLSAQASEPGAAKVKFGSSVAGNMSNGRATKRRRVDSSVESDSTVRISMSRVLKRVLINDWKNITTRKKTYALPRTPSVVDVLNEFAVSMGNAGEGDVAPDPAAIKTVCQGLQDYFNQALGRVLLYRSERAQYGEIVRKMAAQSRAEVYGAEHLLRLIAKLPELMAQVDLEPGSVALTQEVVASLLSFLEANVMRVFSPDILDGVQVELVAAAGQAI